VDACAIVGQVQHAWENPEEFKARLQLQAEIADYQALYRQAFDAEGYHLEQAEQGGYWLGEIMQWACGEKLVAALAKGAVKSVRWVKGLRAVGELKEAEKVTEALLIAAKEGKEFKSFTAKNFRENLRRLLGEAPPNSHAHHVFPQKHQAEFLEAGINIHDPKYGVWWEGSDHLQKAHEYNEIWGKFITEKPTIEEILAKGRELMKENGIPVNY